MVESDVRMSCSTVEEYSAEEDQVSFSIIKKNCNDLLNSENVDKSAALSILKLQHSMENLYKEHMYEKEKDIQSLRNDLVVTKLTHTQAEMIEKLSSDVSSLISKFNAIQTKITDCEEKMQTLDKRMCDLERTCKRK